MTLYDDLTARLTALELDRAETATRIADLEALVADREAERAAIERSAATIADLARFERARLAGLNQRLPLLDDEIADVRRQLANLTPNEWDPAAATHAWPDCIGCRDTVPADVFAARTGRARRHVQKFATARPFKRGEWPDLPNEVAAGEARLIVAACPEIHPDLRSAHDDTPAKLAAWEAACLAEMQAFAQGKRARQVDMAAASFAATYRDHTAKVTVRLPWEFDGRWFPHSICPSDAHADAFAGMLNVLMAALAAAGCRTFAVNLAGTPQCSDARVLRALAALRIPDGCTGELTLDDYINSAGDLRSQQANMTRLDMYVAATPWVTAIGFDEIGPHNSTSDTAPALAALEPVKAEWMTNLCRYARSYAAGRRFGDRVVGLSRLLLFETIYPNGRPISAVLIGDRRQTIGGTPRELVLAGRSRSTYTARNGQVVPSNDPAMATALLAALHK